MIIRACMCIGGGGLVAYVAFIAQKANTIKSHYQNVKEESPKG